MIHLNKFNHRAHSVTGNKVHITFTAKYRRKIFIDDTFRNNTEQLIIKVCTRYKVEIYNMHTASDHIHLLVDIPPSISIARFVQLVKQFSVYYLWISDEAHLKTFFWGTRSIFAAGYFASTTGGANINVVNDYINNQ